MVFYVFVAVKRHDSMSRKASLALLSYIKAAEVGKCCETEAKWSKIHIFRGWSVITQEAPIEKKICHKL